MKKELKSVEEIKKARTTIALISSLLTASTRNSYGLVQKENLLSVSKQTLDRQRQDLEDIKVRLGDRNSGIVAYLYNMEKQTPGLGE
jgi:hypothetical protein